MLYFLPNMPTLDAVRRPIPTLLAAAVAGLTVLLATSAPACRPARPNLAPHPEAFGFPLMDAGALRFEGTANGPVRAQYGQAYFTTAEGSLYAVDVLSRRILWRFQAEAPVPGGPELSADSLLIRDEKNCIYVLDPDGRLVLKTAWPDPVTTTVRERNGRILFGCGSGRVAAVDLHSGRPVWKFDAGAAVCSGPVFSGRLAVFGTEDGRLLALDESGRPAWTFSGRGAVRVDPVAADGGVYFGTEERYFYGLAAATGKKRWQFRLAGAPLHPAAAAGRRLVFAASNSVVYCLSARSGEILWWQGVPSRVVHAPAVADGLVLVSAFCPDVFGYDLRTGRPTGAFRAADDVRTGALWVTPYVFLIQRDPSSAMEKVVFLERDRRPVRVLEKPRPVRR
jgi:outer membrane protein assembly factor BamB